MINVPCRCGRVLMLPDDYAGKTGRCKACGERLLVPFLREGGGAAVIRAEEEPIPLEDVAEPVLFIAPDPPKPDADLDWILPPDPPRRVPTYREPLISVVEPGEGCLSATVLGTARVVCWFLLVGGIVRGVLHDHTHAALVGIAAGIVLVLIRSAKSGPPPMPGWDPNRDTKILVRAVLYATGAVVAVVVTGMLIYAAM